MPPIRSRSSSNSAEQEGRILLAIQAIKNQEIHNTALAARTFNIPRSRLRHRINGIQHRASSRANSRKLTAIEEGSLQKWILSMDYRGAAPRPSMVREMADLLLAQRGTTPVPSVGENWVTKFVKRHPLLSSRFSKRYNYERAKCETRKSLGSGLIWFKKRSFNLESTPILHLRVYAAAVEIYFHRLKDAMRAVIASMGALFDHDQFAAFIRELYAKNTYRSLRAPAIDVITANLQKFKVYDYTLIDDELLANIPDFRDYLLATLMDINCRKKLSSKDTPISLSLCLFIIIKESRSHNDTKVPRRRIIHKFWFHRKGTVIT